MRQILAILAFVGLACFAGAADARGGGRFGAEDKFVEIQALNVPPEIASDPSARLGGEWPLTEVRLYGHYQIHWFFLGAYLTHEGYALKPPTGDRYFALDEENIAEFQALGMLPQPLPDYRIEPLDYAFAYSLWITLAVIAAWLLGGEMTRRKRASPVADLVGGDYFVFIREALVNFAGLDSGGSVSSAERDQIKQILASFGAETTGVDEAAEQARFSKDQLVAYVEGKSSGFNPQQRNLLFHSLIALVAPTGGPGSKQTKALRDYVIACGVPEKQAKREVERMLDDFRPAPAGP